MQISYIDKEKALLDAMEKDNYDLFDGDKEEALDMISGSLMSFTGYVNAVINEQVLMPIIEHRYEGEQYREAVTNLDRNRRICHDAAISNVNIMNRLSKSMGLQPFTEIDTSDRYAVADFCGEFTLETFQAGQGRTMDAAAYGKTAPYDEKQIPLYLRKLAEAAQKTDERNRPDIQTELN